MNTYLATLDRRRRAVGLSMAALARGAKVKYWRVYQGAELTDDEITRLEAVIDAAERVDRAVAAIR
jgi:hypothetical protein